MHIRACACTRTHTQCVRTHLYTREHTRPHLIFFLLSSEAARLASGPSVTLSHVALNVTSTSDYQRQILRRLRVENQLLFLQTDLALSFR